MQRGGGLLPPSMENETGSFQVEINLSSTPSGEALSLIIGGACLPPPPANPGLRAALAIQARLYTTTWGNDPPMPWSRYTSAHASESLSLSLSLRLWFTRPSRAAESSAGGFCQVSKTPRSASRQPWTASPRALHIYIYIYINTHIYIYISIPWPARRPALPLVTRALVLISPSRPDPPGPPTTTSVLASGARACNRLLSGCCRRRRRANLPHRPAFRSDWNALFPYRLQPGGLP
jgi:hypothetical protein